MLNLIYAYRIGSLAIIDGYNTLVGWEVALGIPVGEVVLRGQDDEQKDSLAKSIDSLDHYCPLIVAWLG